MEQKGLRVNMQKMDLVIEFYYLGDMFSAGGGCTQAIIDRNGGVAC